MEFIQFLEKLSNAYSVPGREEEVKRGINTR